MWVRLRLLPPCRAAAAGHMCALSGTAHTSRSRYSTPVPARRCARDGRTTTSCETTPQTSYKQLTKFIKGLSNYFFNHTRPIDYTYTIISTFILLTVVLASEEIPID